MRVVDTARVVADVAEVAFFLPLQPARNVPVGLCAGPVLIELGARRIP